MPSEVPSASDVPSSSAAPTTIAFQAFQARCDATSDGEGYDDCVGGFVRGTFQTCADACIVNRVSKLNVGLSNLMAQSKVALQVKVSNDCDVHESVWSYHLIWMYCK